MPRRWNRIAPGMSKEDVIHFVGEPVRRTYDGNFTNGSIETWYYDYSEPHTFKFEPRTVKFGNGRVLTANTDPTRVEEVNRDKSAQKLKAELAEVIPSDVGFKCDDKSQCLSGKCIDHKCAGPHDCTGAAGSACRSGLDCCSRHCSSAALECI
jgi:hypothetical protein